MTLEEFQKLVEEIVDSVKKTIAENTIHELQNLVHWNLVNVTANGYSWNEDFYRLYNGVFNTNSYGSSKHVQIPIDVMQYCALEAVIQTVIQSQEDKQNVTE